MENEILNDYINGGNPDEWHKKKMKANDRTWFLVVCLICTMFIGHLIIVGVRIQKPQQLNKDSVITYQKTVIEIQKQALDSAVYFHQIPTL